MANLIPARASEAPLPIPPLEPAPPQRSPQEVSPSQPDHATPQKKNGRAQNSCGQESLPELRQRQTKLTKANRAHSSGKGIFAQTAPVKNRKKIYSDILRCGAILLYYVLFCLVMQRRKSDGRGSHFNPFWSLLHLVII